MNHHPEIATLLRRQFGVIAHDQLTGVSARTVSRARACGQYELVLPGVLRSLEHPMTFAARAMAVQLHVGGAGALSGPTAARIYGLRQMPSEHVWFRSAVRARSRLPCWVTRTESAWLLAGEGSVRQHGCWRLLAPAPMLLTLAELFNDHRFERAAEDAWHLRLISPSEAAEFLDDLRGRGRRGVARFDRWLIRTAARPRPSQSDFELDVLEAVLVAGLPEPRRQHPLTLMTGEVIHLDLAWPEVALAVEPGHSWWHGGDLGTRTDQARDRACGEVGWHVMRYDESYRADLAGVGKEVRATYELRRRAGPVAADSFPRQL
jgi:hypothetical protein